MISRTAPRAATPEAIEFVRFCYRRRRVGWPELYDEMCAVAGRGLYRGWGSEELGEQGIGFGLFELPTLASIVGQVIAEEQERGRRLPSAEVTRVADGAAEPPASRQEDADSGIRSDDPALAPNDGSGVQQSRPDARDADPPPARLRLSGAPAGA